MNDLIDRLRNVSLDKYRNYTAMEDAADRIEQLEAVLQEIVDATPANEHKKWPHHHFYLTKAQEGLKAISRPTT